MAYKLNLITELYGETLTRIENDPKEWMDFLECSAMNYKYPFNDQVLIYAQKPDAIACARIDDWQTSGRSSVTFKERLKIESYYSKHASIYLDIKIFFKTIYVVAFCKDAK